MLDRFTFSMIKYHDHLTGQGEAIQVEVTAGQADTLDAAEALARQWHPDMIIIERVTWLIEEADPDLALAEKILAEIRT